MTQKSPARLPCESHTNPEVDYKFREDIPDPHTSDWNDRLTGSSILDLQTLAHVYPLIPSRHETRIVFRQSSQISCSPSPSFFHLLSLPVCDSLFVGGAQISLSPDLLIGAFNRYNSMPIRCQNEATNPFTFCEWSGGHQMDRGTLPFP